MFDREKFNTIPDHVRDALDHCEDAALVSPFKMADLRAARRAADRTIATYLGDVACAAHAVGYAACLAAQVTK